MSACISKHGEYSSHSPKENYYCKLCGDLDEDALRNELESLRTQLAEVTARLAECDDALRTAGIEHPLGAAGIRDLAAIANGRLEELKQAEEVVAKAIAWNRACADDVGLFDATEALQTIVDAYPHRAAACPECGPGYRVGDDGCRHTPQPQTRLCDGHC